jgi:DNA-binding NarL/FixJ family response regulator
VSATDELLKAAKLLQPDVVIVDIGMPSLNGLDAGRRLKQANPQLKLIYLTVNNNFEIRSRSAPCRGIGLRSEECENVGTAAGNL